MNLTKKDIQNQYKLRLEIIHKQLPFKEGLTDISNKCAIQRLNMQNDNKELLNKVNANTKLINSDILTQLKSDGRGAVIAAFHTRLYPYIPLMISKNNYNVKVAISSEVDKEEGKFYRQIMENNNLRCNILHIERQSHLKKIIDNLRKGNFIVFYIDGNMGIKEKNMATFKFFNTPIKVQTGVARLANIAGVPILPTLSYCNSSNEKIIEFLDPIKPSNNYKLQTIKIYKILEKFLEQYTDQWEGWLYFENFFTNNPVQSISIDEFEHKNQY